MRQRKISQYKLKHRLLGLINHHQPSVRGLLAWHFGTNDGQLRPGLSPLLIPAIQIWRWIRCYVPSNVVDRTKLVQIETLMRDSA